MDITGLTAEQKERIKTLAEQAKQDINDAIDAIDACGEIDKSNHSSWWQIASRAAEARGGIAAELDRIEGKDFLGKLFSGM